MGIGTSIYAQSYNDTKAALQKSLPGRELTDADYTYWTNQGGVEAVQRAFPQEDTWDKWQGRLAGGSQSGDAQSASQVWQRYGSTSDPSGLQEALRTSNVTASDLAQVAGVSESAMGGFLSQRLSPAISQFRTLDEFAQPAPANTTGAVFGASAPASQTSQQPSQQLQQAPSYQAEPAGQVSEPIRQVGATPLTNGLIGSIASNPSYQSTLPSSFVPSAPAGPRLISVNENRTSLPQMNANAVSAISGLPINQSRFANAGQPSGMLYTTNPDYISQIDQQRAGQNYISRFGVK